MTTPRRASSSNGTALQFGQFSDEVVPLGGEKHLLDFSRLIEPADGFMPVTRGSGNHAGVIKKPGLLGPLGQSALHERSGLLNLSGGRKRPRDRIQSENVGAVRKFLFGQVESRGGSFATRGEIESKCPGVADGALVREFLLNGTGSFNISRSTQGI